MYRASAVFGAVVLLPNLIVEWQNGQTLVWVTGVVAYVAVVVIAVTRVGSYSLQSLIGLGGCYAIGLLSLLAPTLTSWPELWFLAVPTLATVFFGISTALASLIAVMATLVWFGDFGLAAGTPPLLVAALHADFVLLGAVIAFSIWVVLKGLAEAQVEAEESARILEATLESTGDGILAFDLDRHVLVCNSRFKALTGMPQDAPLPTHDELVKNATADLDDPAEFLARVREVWEKPETVIEDELRQRDGRVYERSDRPQYHNGELVGRVVTLRDRTAERRLEVELRNRQKLEAVAQLAGGVAHDFNNKLQVIEGNARMVLDGGRLCDQDRQALEELNDAARASATLVNELLALGRRIPARPVQVDVVAAAERVVQLLRANLPQGVTIELDAGAVPAVVLDPSHLEQILINVCLNARDALVDGGEIGLRIRRASVKRRGETKCAAVVFEVADAGVGMEPDVRNRALEPFFTTKGDGASGLGLSTAYGMVKQAGGDLEIESRAGEGTTVRLLLPACAQADPGTASASAPGVEIDQNDGTDSLNRSRRVLVVEDEEAVLRFVVRVLERAGYTTLTATDGLEALRALSNGGAVDLLLTDVVMPHRGGPALAADARELQPDLRVLFMSGYSEGEIAREGVIPDGVPLLEKPFSPSELLERIREALR